MFKVCLLLVFVSCLFICKFVWFKKKKKHSLCSVCVVHYVGNTRVGLRRSVTQLQLWTASVRMRAWLYYCLHFLLMLFSRGVMALLRAGTDVLLITLMFKSEISLSWNELSVWWCDCVCLQFSPVFSSVRWWCLWCRISMTSKIVALVWYFFLFQINFHEVNSILRNVDKFKAH